MAEGGSHEQSTKDSDAFYDFNCSECLSRNGSHTEAVFFCQRCNKYLCRHCYVCEHDVIGRKNVDKWGKPSTRTQFDPCPKHDGQLIQLYCPDHYVVCCYACLQSEHRSCGEAKCIPLVVNAKENKADLPLARKSLRKLQSQADKVSKDKTSQLNDLDKTEQRLVAAVKYFRSRVDALMNEMEKKSLDEIAAFKALCKDTLETQLSICDTIKAEMTDLQNKLDASMQDESLLFSRIKQGNEHVFDKKHLLSDIASSEIADKVEFEPYTDIEILLKRLQGLGSLPELNDSSADNQIPKSGDSLGNKPKSQGEDNESSTESDTTRYGTRKKKRGTLTNRLSQSLTPHTKPLNTPCKLTQSLTTHSTTSDKPYKLVKKSSFKVKTKKDICTCDIWGICMTPNGHAILADNINRSLKKLNGKYEVVSHCSLKAGPSDVCHTEADQLAVALSSKSVQFVTIGDSLVCKNSFSTDHTCNSLAYSNKNLYITPGYGETVVYVYTMTGTVQRTISQETPLFSSTRLITSSHDGTCLHVTDKLGLVTVNTNGNLMTTFTSSELVNGPYAVGADGVGNVFVGGFGSHNVVQVGGMTGKKLATIISHSDGLQMQALCFDGVNCRLLVSSEDSDTIHVFHLSK